MTEKEPKLKSITKIKSGEYILNKTIHLKINEDSSLTISYDEKTLIENKVQELIAEFLEI